MGKRIVVIGSGFGGLAAAVRLAARGHDVTMVEKRDQPGGRAYVYRQDGFIFDGGPTVITAPWLITELFELAGRAAEDYVTLVPVDPFYRIFFPDGAHFDYSGDADRMSETIRAFSAHPEDVAGYERFVAQTERIFAKGFTELATKPFLSPLDMVKVAPDLIRLQSYRTVYGLVSRYVKDDRLRQVLSFHPLLVGGNPFQTTSIYALIHHLEREWGIWFAKGGTGAVVAALVRLFEELGGRLRLSAEVERILTERGRATGVRLVGGEEIPADVVVCNADVASAYQNLLPASDRRKNSDRRLRRMRYSMSLVVIYFGTDRRYRDDGSQPPGPPQHHPRSALSGTAGGHLSTQTLGVGLLALPAHADPDRPVPGAARRRDLLRPGSGATPWRRCRLEPGRPSLPGQHHGVSGRALLA